jgi:hypothetical protein
MKDQYCGDINDYRKYGLLRIFAGGPRLKIGVCWMLTPNDARNDGNHRNYLRQPDRFRKYDPQLFDQLRKLDTVCAVERARLIPGARFWRKGIPRPNREREAWLEKMCARFGGREVVFFDPDNGLEVKSQPWGIMASPKHLYWREVSRIWARGLSVVIYQHFPRQARGPFVAGMKRKLAKTTGCSRVMALRTAHVVFLIAAQNHHRNRMKGACEEIEQRWNGQIWSQ